MPDDLFRVLCPVAILNDDLEHVSSDPAIRILGSPGYRVKVTVVRSDTAA
jgi:hypothetical protein